MNRSSVHALTLALALALSGCQAPTQVMVLVDGDDFVWDQLTRLDVRVYARDPEDVRGETERLVQEASPGIPSLRRPFRIPLAPRGRDASRRYRVQVDATVVGGGRVSSRAISGYQPSATRELRLYLAASCIDVDDCEDEQTCRFGLCVDANVDIESLCRPDEVCDAGADARDAGRDTSQPDAAERDASEAGDALDASDSATREDTSDSGAMDSAADTAAADTTAADTTADDTSTDTFEEDCVDPLMESTCPPGQVCGLLDDEVACVERGGSGAGDPCRDNGCIAEHYCSPRARTCYAICLGTADCEGTCTPVGDTGFGFCVPPF